MSHKSVKGASAFLLLVGVGSTLLLAQATLTSTRNCLPPDIRLSDVAEVTKEPVTRNDSALRRITVEQKLAALKATCDSKDRLVDGAGREIVFYRVIGCWGHPPPNYRELLQKQRSALEELRKEHTVIEMTCNPSGAEIP